MIKKIIIILGLLSLVFLPPLVITHLWDLNGKFILGHDVGYRLHTEDFFHSLFYLWSDNSNFGGAKYVNPGAIPIHLVEFVVEHITQNLFLRQYLVIVFWQTLLFCPFIVIYLFYFYKKNPKTLPFFIFATFLYAVNFFNLQGWGVFWRTRFSVQIILPLFFAVFYKTLIEKKINYLFLFVLIIVTAILNGGGSPPLYAPTVLVWLVTFIYLLVIEKDKVRLIFTFLKFSTLYIAGFCSISAFWLYPYGSSVIKSYNEYIAGAGGIKSATDWLQVVAAESSFINIFRLQGFPSWYDNPFHPYALLYRSNEILILASFVLPVLSLSAYLFTRNYYQKKVVLLFYLFILIGIFFTAGSHPPLGGLYKLLFKYIPGFAIFRTPFYKFGAVIWFSFSVLSAFTLYQIGLIILQKFRSKMLYLFYILVIIIFVFAYHFPYFSSRFFKWDRDFSTLVTMPQYVLDYKEWSNTNSKYVKGRVMLLPLQETSFNADAYKWGYWSLDPLPNMISSLNYVGNQTSDKVVNSMINELEQSVVKGDEEKIQRLGRMLDIEYFLLREDVFFNFEGRETENPKDLVRSLDSNDSVENVATFGKWKLYKMKNYTSSRFFLLNSLTKFYGKREDIDKELDLVKDGFIIAGDTKNINLEKNMRISKIIVLPEHVNTSYIEYRPELYVSRIYPDSFLYPLVRLKRETEKRALTSTSQLIDYYLGSVAKNLNELSYLQKKFSTDHIENIEKEVLSRLDSINKLALGIKNDVSTMQIRLKVLGYLNRYEKEVASFPTGYINDNYKIIQEIRGVKKHVLAQQIEGVDCKLGCQFFVAEFPDIGSYSMLVYKDSLDLIQNIEMDGKEIYSQTDKPNVLQLSTPKDWSVIDTNNYKKSTTFRVNTKNEVIADEINLENKNFEIRPKMLAQSLVLTFDYLLLNGDVYVVTIHHKNTISNHKWSESGILSEEGSYVNDLSLPNIGDTIEKISVDPLRVNSLFSESTIRNMKIIYTPSIDIVFVNSKIDEPQVINPLNFSQTNPTQWEVQGDTASASYMFFSEKYDDWQLDQGVLPHFQINGNFNGWIVDKQKSAINTKVFFAPQSNVFLGFIISGFSIFSIVIVLLFMVVRKRIS